MLPASALVLADWLQLGPQLRRVIRSLQVEASQKNPPAPKVLGRDLPDGTRKRLQVYPGGGAFFGQNLLFLIGRDARLQKTL